MEDKTISKEKIEMLFKATLSEFRLSQDFGKTFPEDVEHNIFRDRFAGYRTAIDILGLGADYIAYVAHKGDGNA